MQPVHFTDKKIRKLCTS